MSNKWFSTFVTGLASVSTVACFGGKKEETTTTTTTTTTEEDKTDSTSTTTTSVVRGQVNRGTFKLGSVGHSPDVAGHAKVVDDVVAKFTQDIKTPAVVGDEFFNLPAGVDLKSYKTTNFATDGFRVDTEHDDLDDDEKKKDAFVNMYKKKLDALFVSVTDGIHNSSDAYKSIVEKKEFEDTNLVLVGEKAKSQSGSSSKVFAGGNVSTGSYNKYAAAYAAGFQAAVATLNYSKEEKTFEETNTSFFVGAVNNSTARKKAFAFRRGVEAAAAHPDYAAFLKVKFVSKTADSKTTGKKLYYDVTDWKDENKISEFTGSDDFTDSDFRVIYIAGTTAQDWRGRVLQDQSASGLPSGTFVPQYDSADTVGLIGAMQKWAKFGTTESAPQGGTSSKTALVLDELEAGTRSAWLAAANNADINGLKGSAGDYVDTVHTPGQWYDDATNDDNLDATEIRTYIEMRGVTLLGSIGGEAAGTEAYVQAALKGLFLGESTYMLGKHTIFGAGLKVYNPNPWGRDAADYSLTGADSKGKEHFDKALDHVFSHELTESALIASSPWLK